MTLLLLLWLNSTKAGNYPEICKAVVRDISINGASKDQMTRHDNGSTTVVQRSGPYEVHVMYTPFVQVGKDRPEPRYNIKAEVFPLGQAGGTPLHTYTAQSRTRPYSATAREIVEKRGEDAFKISGDPRDLGLPIGKGMRVDEKTVRFVNAADDRKNVEPKQLETTYTRRDDGKFDVHVKVMKVQQSYLSETQKDGPIQEYRTTVKDIDFLEDSLKLSERYDAKDEPNRLASLQTMESYMKDIVERNVKGGSATWQQALKTVNREHFYLDPETRLQLAMAKSVLSDPDLKDRFVAAVSSTGLSSLSPERLANILKDKDFYNGSLDADHEIFNHVLSALQVYRRVGKVSLEHDYERDAMQLVVQLEAAVAKARRNKKGAEALGIPTEPVKAKSPQQPAAPVPVAQLPSVPVPSVASMMNQFYAQAFAQLGASPIVWHQAKAKVKGLHPDLNEERVMKLAFATGILNLPDYSNRMMKASPFLEKEKIEDVEAYLNGDKEYDKPIISPDQKFFKDVVDALRIYRSNKDLLDGAYVTKARNTAAAIKAALVTVRRGNRPYGQ